MSTVTGRPQRGGLFVGRHDEIARLRGLVEGSARRVLFVHGMSGTGKSVLLRQTAGWTDPPASRFVLLDCQEIEPTEAGFRSAATGRHRWHSGRGRLRVARGRSPTESSSASISMRCYACSTPGCGTRSSQRCQRTCDCSSPAAGARGHARLAAGDAGRHLGLRHHRRFERLRCRRRRAPPQARPARPHDRDGARRRLPLPPRRAGLTGRPRPPSPGTAGPARCGVYRCPHWGTRGGHRSEETHDGTDTTHEKRRQRPAASRTGAVRHFDHPDPRAAHQRPAHEDPATAWPQACQRQGPAAPPPGLTTLPRRVHDRPDAARAPDPLTMRRGHARRRRRSVRS